jgi:hypothetical protein
MTRVAMISLDPQGMLHFHLRFFTYAWGYNGVWPFLENIEKLGRRKNAKLNSKTHFSKTFFEMFTVCFASKVAIGASKKSTKILQKLHMKFRIRWENGDYFLEKNFLKEKWISYGFSIYYLYCKCKFLSNSFNWVYISIEFWFFFIVTLQFWK